MEVSPVLATAGLGKSFPGVRALDDFTFDLRRGEVHCLLGENGAGKSTFIKILSGTFGEYDGEIRVGGRVVRITSPAEAKRQRIATIHQEFNLVPAMTVEENILLGAEPRRLGAFVDHSAARRKAAALLNALGVDIGPGEQIRNLTAAQRQMVEIAKALSVECDVLILDEPTASISKREVDELFRIIAELKRRGTGLIYISHRLQEIAEIADRVTVMRDGRHITTMAASDASSERIIEAMVGRSLDTSEMAATRSADREDVVLSARNLSRGRKVKDVSFDLRRGEILGFAGLVGAGRTETMRLLFAADRPESGDILLNGRPVRLRSPQDAVRSGIGYLSEDRKLEGLVLGQSIASNILLANLRSVSRGIFVSRGRAARVSRDFVKKLRIATPDIEKKAGQLSGGNQQKVVIAKWLQTECSVLIFDEPSRGIDVNARREIHVLIRALADAGKSIIVVSSDLPELIQVSDRIVVMSEGRVTGEIETARTARQTDVMALMLGGERAG
ncbi:sugar ABC transporter ATP-binding protein [Tropicimonas sp. IMCC6043]|uniref:sugar ABC transporter ATP-binding protein n=1 Tax=Tropicimonas sp. IMCC6043 TaxID=2510645 RepID=UPI00101D5BC2|nr:sugar ABC transporter ATP-binding protein [Tropicimonas sp. IMCC6043]RYH12400.1 sugar ABC transporter ATP-binding protein [Tropicimonas sp. IMCC6043]